MEEDESFFEGNLSFPINPHKMVGYKLLITNPSPSFQLGPKLEFILYLILHHLFLSGPSIHLESDN